MPIARESEPPARVCLFLLGAFRLQPPVRLPTRKTEALLAYLALHPAAHSREKLAALLWGDAPDELARGSLRKALTLLRGQLGEELLLADRETVQLNPAYGLWVDALELRSQAPQILAGSADSDHGLDPDLYAGDLLGDFYDDWVLPLREELRDLFLTAVLRLAARAYERCDYEAAIDLAARLLRHDPANEQAHRTLMLAYAATGRRAAALEQFARCQRSLAQELDVAPDPVTLAVYERIKHEQALAPAPQPIYNLPSPITSFVGRTALLADLAETLRSARLVTLTGAGGCGKSRTAIQAAQAAAEAYPDGVLWFELTALADPALVAQALARTLALPEMPGLPASAQVANYLRPRRLLLVMDNCEHLVLACAQLAAVLLAACPRLTILATSREALGIAGEAVCPVPPMPLPDPDVVGRLEPAILLGNESVRLFQERARAVAPHFRLAEQNAATVCAICRKLDGLPLAIELAAARVKVLSPGQIAERLSDRFALLTGGDRLAQPRQQTLRAAIDWSYHLLEEPERAMLRGLSVFAGGFTLEAVEALWQEPGQPAALEVLSRLLDKSLVVLEEREGEARYHMLETVREFASGLLANSGEEFGVRRRHLSYCQSFAETADAALWGAEQGRWVRRLAAEQDNVRTALAWALGDEAAGATAADREQAAWMAGCMHYFWYLRGLLGEGQGWLSQAIAEVPGRTRGRAKALVGAASLLRQQGEYAQAQPLFEESIAIWLELAEPANLAEAVHMYGHLIFDRQQYARAGDLFREAFEHYRQAENERYDAALIADLGVVAYHQGDYAQARSWYELSLARYRERGVKDGVAQTFLRLGDLDRLEGDYERAAARYGDGLALFRELGESLKVAGALHKLGQVILRTGDPVQATRLFEEGLELQCKYDNKQGIVECLAALAGAAAAGVDWQRAVTLFGAATALRDRLGAPIAPADHEVWQQQEAEARTRMEPKAWSAAWSAGQHMNRAEAIAYALGGLPYLAGTR